MGRWVGYIFILLCKCRIFKCNAFNNFLKARSFSYCLSLEAKNATWWAVRGNWPWHGGQGCSSHYWVLRAEPVSKTQRYDWVSSHGFYLFGLVMNCIYVWRGITSRGLCARIYLISYVCFYVYIIHFVCIRVSV